MTTIIRCICWLGWRDTLATSNWDEDKGARRDFALACPIAMACYVLPDRWFPPHFCNPHGFLSLSAWDATVEVARVYLPLWPACWVECPDRSRRSPSLAVQNIRDVYVQELSFVPWEVREQLLSACNVTDVDALWRIWRWRS